MTNWAIYNLLQVSAHWIGIYEVTGLLLDLYLVNKLVKNRRHKL